MRFVSTSAKSPLVKTKNSMNAAIGDAARITVLSVDDHPLLREGIATIINSQSDMSLVAAASNGDEAIEAFRTLRPNVTLMDLSLPDRSGIEVMIAIRAEFPGARIIHADDV